MPNSADEGGEEYAVVSKSLASKQSERENWQEQQPARASDRFKFVYEPSPVVPPDGGYGWVVVAAAFVVNLIADGVTFSFGILLSELFNSLDDSREDISWINSFLAGVPLLLGPVTSVLIDRFGCRSVTIAGGLISGLGFALMFVLPRSTLLFVISGGLLAGFGLGLVFMPPVVAVSFYFVEKRALATGLSMSGSGAGTVVFAFVVKACIEEYTWRGSFLIIGGILLNLCVCGALYRPLKPEDISEAEQTNRIYVQFQQQINNGEAIRADDAVVGGVESNNGGSRSPSSSFSTSSPGSSQSGSPTSRRPWLVGGVGSAPAKSLLSIPTYLSDELSKSSSSSRFGVVAKEKSPVPDEKRLIADLKLGYLKRLAAESPDDSVATVHANSNNRAVAAIAAAVATAKPAANDSLATGNGQIIKANTSHELADYAQRVAKQRKQQKRLVKQKQQQQQEQKQKPKLLPSEEEDETRRLSIVVCLPQLPQCQQQQQIQQQSQQLQQPLRPRLNTASQTVRRQLFPVDRRYFMQHTRSWFSPATQIELWDSCPEFGRLPPTVRHNCDQFCREPASAAKVSMLSKLGSSLSNSKAFRDAKFLFTSLEYVSFLVSNFLLYFWYDITYTFLPDHAKEIGLTNSEVSLIISLIGVSNTIGQIVIGYIGDFPRINTVLLYAFCMSLTGIANFLVPWCYNLASLLVYGLFYGFLVSANYALCSIVIIDLFSLERLTTGYGFMMFFQGFANLVGPPAMGHMRDSDSNYNRAFIYSGIFVLLSNFVIVSIYPPIYRWARECCFSCRSSNSDPATLESVMKNREAEEEAAEPLTSA